MYWLWRDWEFQENWKWDFFDWLWDADYILPSMSFFMHCHILPRHNVKWEIIFSYYESCVLCRATFLYYLFIFAWPWQSHFHTSSKSKWREIKIHHVSVTALAVSVFCFMCLLRKMVHFCKYLNSYSRCSFDFTAGFLVTCAEGTVGRPCMSKRRSFSPTCSQLLEVWFRFNLKWF